MNDYIYKITDNAFVMREEGKRDIRRSSDYNAIEIDLNAESCR